MFIAPCNLRASTILSSNHLFYFFAHSFKTLNIAVWKKGSALTVTDNKKVIISLKTVK